MGITYKNKIGRTFHLCYRVTEEGERAYFFSNRVTGQHAQQLPQGFTITEDARGRPRLAPVPEPPESTTAIRHSEKGQQKPPLVPCPHCPSKVRADRLERHIAKVHKDRQEATEQRPSRPVQRQQRRSRRRASSKEKSVAKTVKDSGVRCPICHTIMPRSQYGKHISQGTCERQPTGDRVRAEKKPPRPSPSQPRRRALRRRKGKVECSICHLVVPAGQFQQHIESGRCEKRANKIGGTAAQKFSAAKDQGKKEKDLPNWAMEVTAYDCGICYQPIYRVWTKWGNWRYYNDKKLTERHRCTWPRDWNPDHP